MQVKIRGKFSDNHAFTLIELMVTVSAIAILASIVTFTAIAQQRNSRDAARNTSATLIAEALENYYEKNNEYPSVASLAGQPASAVKQKLGIADESILRLPLAGESIAPIVSSNPSTTQIAYVAGTNVSANNTQCQSQANGYCDVFALQYKKEGDNSLVAVQGRHGDSSVISQAPSTPSQPSVSGLRVNSSTVRITVAGATCSSGIAQYKIRYNTIAANDSSMPSWSASTWSNSPTREMNPGDAYNVYYQAIAHCINGIHSSAPSSQSSIGRVGTRGDGENWTTRQVASGTNEPWTDTTYGNGRFVAIAKSRSVVMTSTDGENWTSYSTPSFSGGESVAYGGGRFVIIAWLMSSTNYILTSTDGMSWTKYSAPAGTWEYVTYGGGRFVAVGTDTADPYTGGTKYRSMTSTNGTTWTASATPTGGRWLGVTYGYSRFVAVGSNAVATSTDGTSWTNYTAPTGGWQSVAYGNNRFVAVTGNKVMVSNYNGTTWTSYDLSGNWNSVTYGNGRFVAVGYDGKAMTSTDGSTWTSYDIPAGISSLAFGDDYFIGLGNDKVISSP